MEEVVFNVGDVVRMREFLADGSANLRYKEHKANVFTVISCEGGLTDVSYNDGQKKNVFFSYRLELVVAVKPKELAAGDYVVCTSDKFKSAVHGGVYLIERLAGDRLKLKGVSNTLPSSSFTLYTGKPIVEDVGNELLKELAVKVGNDPGVCSYAIMSKDNKKIWHIKDICHARIACDVKEVTHVALNFSGHYKRYDDQMKEDYKVFLNYIVNESPLKECFISRPVDDMVKDGVLMNVDKTLSEVFTAAIATRHFTEFPEKRELFSKIMNLGFDGNTAMFVSTFFDEDDGLVFNGFYGSHHFLASSQKAEELFKFFKEGIKDVEGKPYRTKPNGLKKVLDTVAPPDAYGGTNITGFVKTIKGMKEAPGDWGSISYKMEGDKSLVKVCAKICSLVN